MCQNSSDNMHFFVYLSNALLTFLIHLKIVTPKGIPLLLGVNFFRRYIQ